MKGRSQVIMEDDDGHVLDTHDVFSFQRKHFQPEQGGLTLAEAKGTLPGLQKTVAHHQVDDDLREQRHGPSGGQHRKQKGQHTRGSRTLLGSFQLPRPRCYRDGKPNRRLFELLKSQGAHANQPVTFLSDGGETVRNLPLYLHPLAEHL